MPRYHLLRTVFFLIPAVSLYTVVLGTLSLLSTLIDRTGNLAHGCARAWSRLILKTTGVKVTVQGLERLDPSRSYVFAANHQSIYDIPILFASILIPKAIIVARVQTVSTEKTAVGPTPRTPEGKVDFSGVWDPGLSFTSLGQVPLQPWADEIYKERRANLSKDDPEGHCLPAGVPRISPFPQKFVQTPTLIVVLDEGKR